jgi:hypothetical protein
MSIVEPPSAVPGTCEDAARVFPERLLIIAAVGLIAAAVLQAEPLQSANDRSRWATVWSLVERGTWQIDEIDAQPGWNTIDKVRFRRSEDQPWHFYSSKPPFLSLLAAGLYAIERVTPGWGLYSDTAAVTRLLLLFINVLPFAAALFALARTLRMLGVGVAVRCLILAAAGFGSMLNPYLVTLNNHTPAAACAMLAIAAAVQLKERGSRGDFLRLGFYAAMTACFELPAAQFGVAAFVLAVSVCWRRTLGWFMPAAALPLLVFLGSNWSVAGSLKPFYATYGSETYVYTHNGIPSYWTNPRDLDANNEPLPVYLFHCVAGHHGLLSLSPVLLLSVVGSVLAARSSRGTLRMLIFAGGLMTIITFAFYLSRTENYNYGGNSAALRWMLWLSPFWWLAIVPVMQAAGRWRWSLAGCLLLLSVGSAQWSQQRPWRPSWLYERMEAAGWINYRSPRPPFAPPRESLFAKIPRPGETETFVSSRGDQVTFEAATDASGAAVVRIVAAKIGGGVLIPSSSVPGPVVLSDPGIPLHPDSPIAATAEAQAVAAVRRIFGFIPAGRPYTAGGTLYLPSLSNPQTAWKTERGALRVAFTDRLLGKCVQRCDVLFCEDRPFGVLQWKLTVTAAANSEVLHTETWTVQGY